MLPSILIVALNSVIALANVATGIVVVVAIGRAFIEYMRFHVKQENELEESKSTSAVGGHLVLALEFQLGANIIRTALEPTSIQVLILGGLVGVWMLLEWSVERENSVTWRFKDLKSLGKRGHLASNIVMFDRQRRK